jgi:D-beta-D-heptose 7-phosphate kinase/D-beta-D-heptose 1-phosphate adenosyltransferase|tara:strand:- start:262 stop:666 length:405 start_codon:yes stop_codon:yes gene_type:complete
MVKVWVNGCFDVLHRGHYELFNYAKSLGDKLAVGIDSDEKVSKDKGTNRPFNNINDRVYALQSLKAVNEVYVFNSRKELEDLIENYQPDYLVVGSDWKDKDVVGGHFAKEIVYFNRIEGYSTTSILTNDREQVI